MRPIQNAAGVILVIVCSQAAPQVDRSKGGSVDPTHFHDRYVLQSGKQSNLQFVNDPAGSNRTVIRLSVGKSDPTVFSGLRTEIIPRNEYVKTGVRWYAISFYVPPEWQLDPAPIVVFQLHTSQRDVTLSPPVSLVIRGNRLELDLWANYRPIHGTDHALKDNSAHQTILISSLEKSRWYCFVARADWSSDLGNGSFGLWLNSDRVYQAQRLPNAYETWLGNYPKTGLYAPAGLTAPAENLIVDFIHLGGPRSSLSDMTSLTPCGANAQETMP
jgi:hypothetical protein